ncbi:MAG TPA: tetratricopeptide repeat protein [Methanocorpusculum sp.]|nr:tetratricopeptide repeat protein [Methanocorpusculum sp.]HJJ39834.1 tetratricopeptide repeat protein [Methanocorpusculum sp.]HJJ49213.1 tetratricopeptide repeat protein [Methanocorpusculum sp.]HJJ56871.1 tetratricopeptide repeat protein [Methanocorpusculum sp.]
MPEKEKIRPITSTDMIFISEITRRGSGQEKNPESALIWLEKAADEGDCTAMEMLAMNYLNGGDLVEKDEKEAVRWFEKAATAGSPDAMVFLGLAHLLEIGVPFEPMTALFWLRKASERGNTDADEVLTTFFEQKLDKKIEDLQETVENQ